MALIKNIASDFGVGANYFNIARIDFYPRQGTAGVLIHGFVSKKARQDGNNPVVTRTLSVQLQPGVDITQAAVYSFLKKSAEFADATDD